MSKRTLIGLILAIACLLSACTKLSDDQKIAVEPETKKPATVAPSNTEDLLGKWYSENSGIVLQFGVNNTVSMYEITPGYYEYNIVLDGTYTYDGITLTLKFPSSDSDISFTCSVDKDSMTLIESFNTINFVPATTLPTAHPTYTFPDFEAIAQANPLLGGNYTGLTIESDITKEGLLEQLTIEYWAYIASYNKSKFDSLTKLTSGVAAEGNFVNINYEGKLDGVAFAGGTAENQIICVKDGTGMIDGFCVGVIGKEVGQTFDVPVTFPENYQSTDLAGKEAVFTMTLNWIYEGTVLTDEIAAEYDQESLEAWINVIYKDEIGNKIWDLIPDLADVEIPAEAYNFFHQYYMDTIHETAFNYFDNNYSEALAYYGYTEETLLEYSKSTARTYLLGAQIVANFNLTASEELTKAVLSDYMELYNLTEAKALEDIENDGKNEFRARLLRELAMEYLLENNNIVAKSA